MIQELVPWRNAVPLIEGGPNGALTSVGHSKERAAELVGEAERYYGRKSILLGDWLSRRWLAKSKNPYRDEIVAVGEALGCRGAALLNLSYEWGCTSAVGPDPAGDGNRLLRTLDWKLPGIGRNVIVVRQHGDAGSYLSVTWPGFVGVVTAMAPGRFAAAINQPDLRVFTRFRWVDWVLGRHLAWRSKGLPPVHVLRHVFDTCHTYAEARQKLIETPLCTPAFFILSGVGVDEACVIERFEDGGDVHEGPTSIANQGLKRPRPGHVGVGNSAARRALLETLRDRQQSGFDWVVEPILNNRTRVTVVANATRGVLSVQGWENGVPATRPLTVRDSDGDNGARAAGRTFAGRR